MSQQSLSAAKLNKFVQKSILHRIKPVSLINLGVINLKKTQNFLNDFLKEKYSYDIPFNTIQYPLDTKIMHIQQGDGNSTIYKEEILSNNWGEYDTNLKNVFGDDEDKNEQKDEEQEKGEGEDENKEKKEEKEEKEDNSDDDNDDDDDSGGLLIPVIEVIKKIFRRKPSSDTA